MKKLVFALMMLFSPLLPGRETLDFGGIPGPSWRFIGKIPLIPRTAFLPVPNPERPDRKKLVVDADCASGMMATAPEIDLQRTPIMRWRWRVVRPIHVDPGADEKDDQALTIYVGDGEKFRHRAVSYRWEVNTEPGKRYRKHYSAGALAVECIPLRNRNVPEGKWITEERNVLDDYSRSFGKELNHHFAVLVGANTQHLRQHSTGEIDFIEFLSEEEAEADPIPDSER